MANYNYSYNQNKEHESNLAKIRVEEGYTIKKLAKFAGTSVTTIIGLQNGMISPIYENRYNYGEIKPIVIRLANILKCSLADLFPRYICDIQRAKSLPDDIKVELLCSEFTQNNANSGQYNFILKKTINKQLEKLSKRERFVIKQRFWNDETLRDIGDMIGVTGSMVMVIEARALKKLRHPSISENFETFS